MKSLKLILGLALGLGALNLNAGTPELAASMRKQQRADEEKLVRLWLTNQRGQELEQVLGDYVAREVRLQAIADTRPNESLLGVVTKHDPKLYDTPQALAQALVLEHYNRQGIDIAARQFVSGTYLIKKDCLKAKAD